MLKYSLLMGSFISPDAALRMLSESFAFGGIENTEIFYLWVQSSCQVSHNRNRSALPARLQVSQRQRLIHFCFN